jgi:hypothetical protein
MHLTKHLSDSESDKDSSEYADTNSDQSDRDMFDTINSIITISPEKENHNLNNMSMNI